MGVMYTGDVDLLPSMTDHDYAPVGFAGGDTARLEMLLQPPSWANSFSFKFNFCSREYPEWVGSKYNDLFTVEMTNSGSTGQIVFDSFGNEVSINNALFVVVDPASLAGTGFDEDGCTGWVQTIAPVDSSGTLGLLFRITDVSDGRFDSLVTLDDFSFDEDAAPDGPWTGEVPDPALLEVYYASPKEGPLEGGGAVALRGANFSPDVDVWVGDAQVTDLTVTAGGDSMTLGEMPSAAEAGVPGGGVVDVVVRRGADEASLRRGYTYWDESGGELPPRIDEVVPSQAGLAGGFDVRVRGVGFDPGAMVEFRLDGGAGAAVSAEVVGLQTIDGEQELLLRTPAMNEGWTELVLRNPDGLEAVPPFPFLFTADGQWSGPGSLRGSGCTCDNGEGAHAGWLALLAVLALGGVRRDRRRVEAPTKE